jgi:K+:H+ antiporter
MATSSRNGYAAAYLLLVGIPIALVFVVLRVCARLNASATHPVPTASIAAAPASFSLLLLVAQVAVVIGVSRAIGVSFKWIRQPQVVGEMVAGILLGPSFLGNVAPAASTRLFPAASLAYLNAVSQIGLLFFMFLVGVSLNPKALRDRGRAAVLASNASIALPFCLGTGLALILYPRLAANGVRFTSFALFIGCAMSITAFPVLARILSERRLLRTEIGMLAIACAAVDDVTGWCILAYVVALVRAEGAPTPFWLTVGGVLVYILLVLYGMSRLRRRLERSFDRQQRLTDEMVSLLLVLMLLSALATEWLGVHSLFGAFFLGAMLPKGEGFVKALQSKLESLTVIALLPLFFAFSGLRTNIGLVYGRLWFYVLLVIATAIVGKIGGSMLGARVGGVSWRNASTLGILMNTRGLIELVVLNIGLDVGVISQQVFTMMVLMALATTFMTSPLLDWMHPEPAAA